MGNTTPEERIAGALAAPKVPGADILKAILKGFNRFGKSRPALVALIIAVIIILTAVLADYLPIESATNTHLSHRFEAPGEEGYILGSDTLGRDLLSRTIYGARISLFIAVSATLIAMILGVLIGLFSGYKGGFVDTILMRIADGQIGFPFLVVAVTLMGIIGGGTTSVIILLGYWGWVYFGRVIRGEILTIKEAEYITAARAIGASGMRIAFRHVLPQTFGPMLILATFYLPAIMVIEASLSFLGLGVQPPTPSWGNMLAESRAHLERAWWVMVAPGFSLSLAVLTFNIVGDRLRDVLDPRLRGVTY